MRIKFIERKREGDQFEPDSWIEEYRSLKGITDEMKEGCDIVILFDCNACKKEIETLDEADVNIGLCKKCQKGGVKNVE